MNDLLYFNNNTPNYEYILKDIIIDNNLSNLNDFFTKDQFDSIFIKTKDELYNLLEIYNDRINNYKINNINKIDEKANDIVKGYISALNERSVASLERYLHFPHTRVMLDGESRCWETARKYLDDFQSRLEEDSWHSTELLSVDTEIISKKKCHTRISFKRLRRDGSIINTYHSLYVITEKNKSWGILFGSGTG